MHLCTCAHVAVLQGIIVKASPSEFSPDPGFNAGYSPGFNIIGLLLRVVGSKSVTLEWRQKEEPRCLLR